MSPIRLIAYSNNRRILAAKNTIFPIFYFFIGGNAISSPQINRIFQIFWHQSLPVFYMVKSNPGNASQLLAAIIGGSISSWALALNHIPCTLMTICKMDRAKNKCFSVTKSFWRFDFPMKNMKIYNVFVFLRNSSAQSDLPPSVVLGLRAVFRVILHTVPVQKYYDYP